MNDTDWVDYSPQVQEWSTYTWDQVFSVLAFLGWGVKNELIDFFIEFWVDDEAEEDEERWLSCKELARFKVAACWPKNVDFFSEGNWFTVVWFAELLLAGIWSFWLITDLLMAELSFVDDVAVAKEDSVDEVVWEMNCVAFDRDDVDDKIGLMSLCAFFCPKNDDSFACAYIC